MSSSNLNLLTANRWIAQMPTKGIDPEIRSTDINFNLLSFDLNEIEIASNPLYVMGHSIEMPAYVKNSDKTITFNYAPDSSLSQYVFLRKWFDMICMEDGTGLDPNTESFFSFAFPIRIFPLSEFKNPPIEFILTDSWIKNLAGLSFDYTDSNASPLRHAFTITYTKMETKYNPVIR